MLSQLTAPALVLALTTTTAASAAQALQAPVPPPDFRPGAAGAGDPYFPRAGNGGFDVVSYDVDLDYRPKKRRLAGRVTVTATATSDLSRFNLDLTGMTVRSVTVDGRPAPFTRDGGELVITPAAGLRRGARFAATVRYDGTPSRDENPNLGRTGWIPTADGAVTMSQPRGTSTWMPVSDHPSDKALFRYSVTVPEKLRVLANGDPAGTTRNGTRTTYRWRTDRPMASYLAMLAIGKYSVRDSRTPGGIRNITGADPALRGVDHAAFHRTTGRVTDWGGQVFGPFPFRTTGGILDDVEVGYALETQNRPVYPGRADTSLIVHELAHQWFGDSVTPKRWKDIWLNEGFATYAEWMWDERHGGPSAQKRFAREYRRAASDPRWKTRTGDPGPTSMFATFPVYTRGAMTLHALRRKVGDPDFSRILREWPRRNADRTVSTADFVSFAESVSGQNLNALFRAWLYTGAKPKQPVP